jgi:hypothetical protein
MTRLILRDDQYRRIEKMLPGKASDVGVAPGFDRRRPGVQERRKSYANKVRLPGRPKQMQVTDKSTIADVGGDGFNAEQRRASDS